MPAVANPSPAIPTALPPPARGTNMDDIFKITPIETSVEDAIEIAARLSRELQAMHEDGIEDDECEHEFDPDEGFMCLHCGAEGLESVMSQAHEIGEGER